MEVTDASDPVPADAHLSGQDLIRQYANFLHPRVAIQASPSKSNGESRHCDVCGQQETIQGNVALLVDDVRMRCAQVGTRHTDLCYLFEEDTCTPEQFHQKVEVALAGQVVAGAGE